MDTFDVEGTTGLSLNEPLIFEQGRKGRRGVKLPVEEPEGIDIEDILPEEYIRSDIDGFPELSEREVVRHFTRLSQWNYGVDSGFYPLGSCTMKYNPKINEELARLEGFTNIHPYQPEETIQGALQLMYELQGYLKEISGMDAITLQPSAGAQGELTGMMMIKRYFVDRGEDRRKVLIPDTAHGTNPASCALMGYDIVVVRSGEDGILHKEDVSRVLDRDVAALMLTNPNTLGLFERNIKEIAEMVHSAGGLVYCDGANLNALMGVVKLGDIGVDVMHFNLHKTFSTPHGGGGPGSGPVGVKEHLSPYLPIPRIERDGCRYFLDSDHPKTIGRVRGFYGNFGILVRAFAYILSMGGDGLKKASEMAVLNSNYIRDRLKSYYHLPYDSQPCMHECVFSDKYQIEKGVKTLDIAKRLIDYGYHPPTIYFPLVVHGAIMIEPTETEDKDTIDRFVSAMIRVAEEVDRDPVLVKTAPHKTKTGRCDEVRAARNPVLRWEEKARG